MTENTPPWLMLVASLPGRRATPRMRLWRALKAAGAAILRDGVYVLPGSENARALFDAQAKETIRAGGNAHVIAFMADGAGDDATLRALFDRTVDYAASLERLNALRSGLPKLNEVEARRRFASMRRELDAISANDFFPGVARDQAQTALTDAERAFNARFSPDEPHAKRAAVPHRNKSDYRGRTWATRRHMWIDRVASAWLVRRFIDRKAKFLWLKNPANCPKRAVGFDFDGAEFSHVGARVTFEVLMAGFGLDCDPRLTRLGRLIHFLDVGGVSVPDAAGFASVMAGARARHGENDDALLKDMSIVLDSLYAAYPETEGGSP